MLQDPCHSKVSVLRHARDPTCGLRVKQAAECNAGAMARQQRDAKLVVTSPHTTPNPADPGEGLLVHPRFTEHWQRLHCIQLPTEDHHS